MGSLQFTSSSLRILSLLGFALVLNACGPQGLNNGQMSQLGATASGDRGREDQLLNRLFRDSPAGQPPPAIHPKPQEQQKTQPHEPQTHTQGQPQAQTHTQSKPQQHSPEIPPQPQEPHEEQPEPQDGPIAQNEPGPAIQSIPAQVRGYWDERVSDGRKWTGYAVAALNNYGEDLLKEVPDDIANYCPKYSKLNRVARIDFWVKVISAIAAVESAYRPSSSYKEKMNDRNGNRVVSRGLLQISLESSHLYGCATNNDGDLTSPKRNIECGVKILNRLVPADGVISRQGNEHWYGAARYWSTLRPVNQSSQTIRALLRTNPHCR